jgi:arylsulfatase
MEKGGTVTLFVDGQPAGTGRVEHTEPMIFSADETCDIGRELGSPVTEEYGADGNAFSGRVHWVEIDLGADAVDADHYLTGAERLHLAMGLQ